MIDVMYMSAEERRLVAEVMRLTTELAKHKARERVDAQLRSIERMAAAAMVDGTEEALHPVETCRAIRFLASDALRAC